MDPELKDLTPQNLIKRQHKGPLKILAFSDYRVHDINELLDFVKGLKEKPDLIVYAGDDIRRFVPLPLEYLNITSIEGTYPDEIEEAPSGFIIRLPEGYDEDLAKARILTIYKVVHRIHQLRREGKLKDEKQLKEVLADEIPSAEIIRSSVYYQDNIRLVDNTTKTTLFELDMKRFLISPSFYKFINPDSIKLRKLGNSKGYVHYYFTFERPEFDVFEELASNARYGLVTVLGNADGLIELRFIRGRNVYELHTTWLKIGSFLIVGLEDSRGMMDPFGNYIEDMVKSRLEYARKMLRDQDRMIIVSHIPPRGILDRAMRFGDRSIGSRALRDFIEEYHGVIPLVICGHVHRCGGKYERLGETLIVNVSSHDDHFSRANIAWISLNERGVEKDPLIMTLPSPIEQMFKKENRDFWLKNLQTIFRFSNTESVLFIRAFEEYGWKLFDDLPALASLKFRYGFTWDNIFRLYSYGVRKEEQITESVYKAVLNKSNFIHKAHLKRAFMNIKREKEKGAIYLMNPLPSYDGLVIFDTEYSETDWVLFGFLDTSNGSIDQFWLEEKEKIIRYVNERRNYLFMHWAGSDRKLLKRRLNCTVRTFDLMRYVQTSLVAPIQSSALRHVHDILHGRVQDELWVKFFYGMDGFRKLYLCSKILRGEDDPSTREELANANRMDILAMWNVINRLMELPVREIEIV